MNHPCPECEGNTVRGKCKSCGWAEKPADTSPAKADRPKCCLCRERVDGEGWCGNCRTWPINATPIRRCNAGHVADTAGWCKECVRYILTELDPQPGEWRDTGRGPKLCTKAENIAQAKTLQRMMSGPGWPEKEVPLRMDFYPRRWDRRGLELAGTTPLGYDIVRPVTSLEPEAPSVESEVPF